MPKVKTSKSSSENVQVVPATLSSPLISASTPNVEVEKVVKPNKKARLPKVASSPETQQPIVSAPVVEETTQQEVSDVEVTATETVEFIAKLQQLSVLISALKTEYRALEKKWTRDLKLSQKLNSRRKRKAGNRAPSGFVKPTRISDELAKFLDKPSGSEMARTEVTRDINKYIRTNNLQDKDNGRKIIPDAKLAALLKLKKTDELTYFNLQRYMSPHFAKVNKDTSVVV
jgi:upstream activation factor subunit UAF30